LRCPPAVDERGLEVERPRPYDPCCVVSDLRKTIAVGIALLVTAFTLGCVRVNWTGEPGADSGEEDPGRAAVSRSLDPDLGPGRRG
jgi:hypothetical protein